MSTRRELEVEKYRQVYKHNEKYVVSKTRRLQTILDLEDLPCRGSLFEVGCGPGLLLLEAERLGFDPVAGCDVVDSLCDGKRIVKGYAHAVPVEDKSFDVACLFDVIEHLLPGDDEAVCRELNRIARKHVLISAANHPSVHLGMDLHVNKRDYGDWHRMFQKSFSGKVYLAQRRHRSPMWRVDL